MRKPSTPIPLTRTEQKAAETNARVKEYLAKVRRADDLKISRLKALRLALEAQASKGNNRDP
jgi:hypothetical protein